MSQNVTYTFYAEVGGEPASNLTPSFSVFREVNSGVDLQNLPEIVSFGDGFYKYIFSWPDVSIPGNLPNSYLVKIDLGETVSIGERFIINRIERHDYLPVVAASIQSDANLIKASADRIETATDKLVELVNYMLDMEQGSWRIINNQLVVYNPDGVEMMRHQLLSFTGTPTSINPYQRNKISISIPRPGV